MEIVQIIIIAGGKKAIYLLWEMLDGTNSRYNCLLTGWGWQANAGGQENIQ